MSKFQVFGEDALFTNVRGKPIEADTIQAAVEVEKVDLLSRGGPKTEVEITQGEVTELAPLGYYQLQVKGTRRTHRWPCQFQDLRRLLLGRIRSYTSSS